MAAAGGRSRAPVSEQLLAEPYRFDFFQAVRLLERIGREASRDPLRRYPVGQDYWPKQEIVRFGVTPSLSFPAGPIGEIRRAAEPVNEQLTGRPPQMTVSFMGLTGPNGALPQHYTSLLIARVRAKDYALRDFLDLFNHRAVSLFYRAWEKYRFTIAYESAQTSPVPGAEDLFTRCLYCLIGLGTGGLRRRLAFDDEAFLFYAGHFAHYPRSAISLEMMLADYFELPVQVRQFLGQWLYLSKEDQSSLPCAPRPRGLNNQLGASLVIGERVWDVEGKFRVRLGPLGYRQFRRFMPSGDALQPLCQMVRAYVGPQFDFDAQPVLKAEEVPWCRLGGDGADPARLGWNTWVRSGPCSHDVDDAVFSWKG
jgi:type VI secretion system protein ImpH